MSTNLQQSVLKKIQYHLESSYPNEACGFLLGSETNNNRIIIKSIAVDNKSPENLRRRFVIDPVDYIKAERQATKEGLTLLGVYHSHPDQPAIPSVHDLEFAQPFFSYLIISIYQGALASTKSYRLFDKEFIEEKLETVQEAVTAGTRN